MSVSGKESVPSLETIPGCGHRVLETLGFEGKYQLKPSGQCVLSNTRVSLGTLCPLGQSKKAIGHESQIGPCVATLQVDNCQAWSFQKANGVVTTVKWNHRGNRNKYLAAFRDEANRTPEQDHSQIVGARPLSLAECREKNLSAPSRGGDVSLDIPLYRTASG